MTDRVAVYVAADISLPEVLRMAAGMGAHIDATDVSRTDTHRVITIDADVAGLLAEADSRLRFVPDITAVEAEPEPEPEPVVDAEPVKPVPVAKPATVPVKAPKPKTTGDAAAKPKKKTKAKKTTARRKTRGANGGES